MDLDGLRALLTPEGQQLLGRLPRYEESSELAVQARLRADHPASLVAAALTQARLRGRARAKFGDAAARMYFTAAGLEQATRSSVASLRAERFVRAGVKRVADLCSGIGGDALALAAAGLQVNAVERDPLACAVVAANAGALGLSDRVEVVNADVLDFDPDEVDAAFIDPARRNSRGRVFDPDAYSPPFGFIDRLRARVPEVCMKVAPGIAHDLVPTGMEAEWVSDSGDVTEAALWAGRLSTGTRRRATLLPSRATLREKTGPAPAVRSPGRWLYEPDGAVIRAHLVAEFAALIDGWLIDPTIAYVCADAPVRTPFASAYEVLDVMPFQLKRLRASLRARDVGSLTIKKRGFAMEPSELRRALRLSGNRSETIVVTRAGGRPTVLVIKPADDVADVSSSALEGGA